MNEQPTSETAIVIAQYNHHLPNWLATEVVGKVAQRMERERDEARKLARELRDELEKQHKFSSGFSDTSTKTPFAKMQRDTARLIAKAKEVLG